MTKLILGTEKPDAAKITSESYVSMDGITLDLPANEKDTKMLVN